jgi:hypothetical protein
LADLNIHEEISKNTFFWREIYARERGKQVEDQRSPAGDRLWPNAPLKSAPDLTAVHHLKFSSVC